MRRARPSAELERLYQIRLEHVVAIDQPLLLISQVQRSGGTLLSQLLDGHPQCHAHPGELWFRRNGARTWPDAPAHANPAGWFDVLREPDAARGLVEGYTKHPDRAAGQRPLPFLFLSSLQEAIFRRRAPSSERASRRAILDAYMTSYFNAWIDNQNLFGPAKKRVVAFMPRLVMDAPSVRRFFQDYPDGTLVCVVRDPWSWFVSFRALKRRKKQGPRRFGSPEAVLREWIASCEAILAAKATYGGRVYVLGFEELLRDPEGTMRHLVGDVDLDFTPSLLKPTFNRLPISPNSAFALRGFEVSTSPLAHRRRALTAGEAAFIERTASDLYRRVLALRTWQPTGA